MGESKGAEGRIVANNEMFKIRLKYVLFLTTQDRQLRQAKGNAMRAQRNGPKSNMCV